jgi:hypothetical protein
VTTVRLWSDFGLPPVYVDDGRGVYDLFSAEEVAERFGLPAEVVREVAAWDALYQDLYFGAPDDADTYGWTSPQQQRDYLDRGRAVARLLRAHLPADVGIEYLADESVREWY